MSVSQQPSAPSASHAEPSGILEKELGSLLQAIRSEDGEAIAAAIDSLCESYGPAAAAPIVAALEANQLREKLLATMKNHAQTRATALAWTQLASAAAIVGSDDVAVEAANNSLKVEPANLSAAVLLVGVANRRGDHETALRVIGDLTAHVPAARDQPFLILQTALAEIGRQQPKNALSVVNTALPRLVSAGMEFDAQVMRARALRAITGHDDDVVTAWERAIAVAKHPAQAEASRDELIAALWEDERYDDCLREVDLLIAGATNPTDRTGGLKIRVNVLVKKGDIDGALAAMEDLLATTSNSQERIEFRLQQVGIAANAGRWKDVAARFDAAVAEVPQDAADGSNQRHAIQMQKAQALAAREIDLVIADLEQLDATWTAGGWPLPIELRVVGLMSAGRNAEALSWLNERLERSPALADHPSGHHLRAEILLKLGETTEAMAEYERGVSAAGKFTDPRAFGSALYCALTSQQWNEAVTAYQRLLELHPTSVDSTVSVIAAQAYVRLGQLQKALELTDGELPILPNILVMRDLCRVEAQVRLGLNDEAIASSSEALKHVENLPAGSPPIAAEFLLSLHNFRAQAFNQTDKFEEARKAATAAIDVPDDPSAILPGLTAFVRLGAYMQRSLAFYRLGKTTEAQDDINQAITRFSQLRNSPIMGIMKRSPELESFDGALWYAKGAVLNSESRSEEALAAYTRAEKLEKHGASAAIARGYSLSSTGAFTEATFVFDTALTRASSPLERAEAFAGKGRALIRLKNYEKAIAALQAALDARLTSPDDDPVIFEQLGIAYSALQRYGAAKRAFDRAWVLTKPDQRRANLARGITAAELRLGEPERALEFIEGLPSELAEDRALLFNRALALDGLGRRRAAIPFLVRAKDAGLDRAQLELDRLDAPAGLGRWTHYWFGAQASQTRRAFGIALAIIAGTILAAPLLQWWHGKLEWYLPLLPAAVALLLLALPNMKSIGFEGAGLSFSVEPLSATGRDVAEVAAPESFTVPTLSAVSVTTR